ncbi:MAG: DUF5618 family protein [Bacteroidales bacterium]|jgi:uncharacterized protein (UPF0332 family)|nr:DUF5618 family protein [Bacteroidales bacterium]
MEQEHPIREAERYLQNARQILSEKAGKDGDYYSDRKYVKIAGHAAWCGILVALDAALGMKESLKHGQRLEFKDYRKAVGKIDRKTPRLLTNSYDTLHKTLGYDGNLSYKIVQYGLEEAKDIIMWAEKQYGNSASN